MARWFTVACACLLAVAVVASVGLAAPGRATAGPAGHASADQPPGVVGAGRLAVSGAPAAELATRTRQHDDSRDEGHNDDDGGGEETPDDGWAVPERVDEQPGDPATIPVTLGGNATSATVVIENSSVGYRLAVTVIDADGDGVVELAWNTYHAGVVPSSAVANRTVDAGPDRVVSANRTTPRRGTHLPEGRYAVSVRHDGRLVANGTVDLSSDPLRRASITVVEGPPLADPADALARSGISDTVELDEWLFVVVERPAIHGYVHGIDDLTGNGTEGVRFELRNTDTGEPADLSNATFLRFPEYDEFVVGIPPNASILDAGRDYVAEFTVDRSNPYGAGLIRTHTDVHILPAGAQPDRAVLEVVDVTAPETVIEGHDAEFEVDVVNSGEREGTATVVVTMEGEEVVGTVTVPPRSQGTVVVEFDTHPLTEGETRWFVRVDGGVRNFTGTLSVRLTNETPNEDPTLVPGPRRGQNGGQPGFGALAALLGLCLGVGGRVLALRRE